uniref:Uncharacterized protein n=1 Tax=Plectus sambesii TaxID=2011161 RepID=A0A914VYQ4_9BILA
MQVPGQGGWQQPPMQQQQQQQQPQQQQFYGQQQQQQRVPQTHPNQQYGQAPQQGGWGPGGFGQPTQGGQPRGPGAGPPMSPAMQQHHLNQVRSPSVPGMTPSPMMGQHMGDPSQGGYR